jgi:hypothetical protein
MGHGKAGRMIAFDRNKSQAGNESKPTSGVRRQSPSCPVF